MPQRSVIVFTCRAPLNLFYDYFEDSRKQGKGHSPSESSSTPPRTSTPKSKLGAALVTTRNVTKQRMLLKICML